MIDLGMAGWGVVRSPPPLYWRRCLLEKEIAARSSTLVGKCPGQRSLAGYSLWGRELPAQLSRRTDTAWSRVEAEFNMVGSGVRLS